MKLTKKSLWLMLVIGIAALTVIYYLMNSKPAAEETQKSAGQSMPAMEMGQSNQAKDIVISPGRLQTLGVRVDTIQYRKLDKVIRTIGRVDYDERLLTIISTKVSGWIEKLLVDYTGKFVEKGAPLYSSKKEIACMKSIARK
jgi:Cu(I)/Ag(I) efflux system membrane fusion protein